MNITYGQAIGKRPYQEDRYVIFSHGDIKLIAVFDGHGGSQTVNTLETELPIAALRYIDRVSNPLDYINTIYSYLDERTMDIVDGSTASMALITPEKTVLATLGDSPIQVLMKNGDQSSMPEHNVRSNYEEAQSAMIRGGVIVNGYLYDPTFPYSGLQMSRCFGDTRLRNVLSQTPETSVLNTKDIQAILVASDGLTDPAHETAPFLLTKHSTGNELTETFKAAFDNVTAVVIQF